MQIFPISNAWNEIIVNRPVLTNSDAMIARIISDLDANKRTLRAFKEMNFVLAPDNQPNIPILFTDYPDDSDFNGGSNDYGLYPIPTNMPVETWPSERGGQSLEDWQADDVDEDRHSIVVQPGNGNIWETWHALRIGTNWQSANGAKFNLNTNGLRTPGYTSGDAAGLPMFPALVRFDECERGMVEHACRIVVKRSRYNTYIYPATHYASSNIYTSPDIPAMGQRVRLKSTFNIPAGWTLQEKAVLLGLKKYGAMVADNGNFFSISVTPDHRWPNGCFDHLNSIAITNFEVISTTTSNTGPRAGIAPFANAGPDQSVAPGVPLQLPGYVNFSGASPIILWKRYSGPTNLVFGNTALTNTTVTFNTNGVFTLMLSADDGVHAVAYDATVITVGSAAPAIQVAITQSNTNANLTWTGGTPPFVIERTYTLPAAWGGVVTTSQQNASVPITNASAFFRVRGN